MLKPELRPPPRMGVKGLDDDAPPGSGDAVARLRMRSRSARDAPNADATMAPGSPAPRTSGASACVRRALVNLRRSLAVWSSGHWRAKSRAACLKLTS